MKKYLLALAAAALCLGGVASCEKDDEKDKESERETTLVEEGNTLKFLEGAWISEGKLDRVSRGDSVYRYYFLYVDEQAKGTTGYDDFTRKNGVEVEGGRGHRYCSFYYKLKEEFPGRIRAHSYSWAPEYQYAVITSYTDTTLTLEQFFSWGGPMTLKKTDVQVQWR